MIQQSHSRHISGENHNSKGYMSPMVIAALFTIAKAWKQPKYPLREEWIHLQSGIYIHNGILLIH